MWFNLFKSESEYKIRSHTLTKDYAIHADFENTLGFQRTDPLGILIKEKEKEVWILHNPDSEYYEDLIKEVNRL